MSENSTMEYERNRSSSAPTSTYEALLAVHRQESERKLAYEHAKATAFLAFRVKHAKENISATRDRVTLDPAVLKLRRLYEEARVERVVQTLLASGAEPTSYLGDE